MNVLLDEAQAELTVRNSRFVAEALIVHAQAEARERLHAQKLRYPDATHVCHAFVVGAQGEVCGMSDDGEPGGTAGRPMLDVLRGSSITDIMVTVTRWFGGTLLGTGGLVRAYGDAVKAVLSVCRTEELVAKKSFFFSVDWGAYEAVKRALSLWHVGGLAEDFGAGVTIRGDIWEREAAAFARQVQDMTRGKATVVFGGSDKQ